MPTRDPAETTVPRDFRSITPAWQSPDQTPAESDAQVVDWRCLRIYSTDSPLLTQGGKLSRRVAPQHKLQPAAHVAGVLSAVSTLFNAIMGSKATGFVTPPDS